MIDRIAQIRNEILLQLYGYRPAQRSAERIAHLARMEGEVPDLTAPQVRMECDYLCGKGLVSQHADPVARQNKRYKITSAGIDYLEENALI